MRSIGTSWPSPQHRDPRILMARRVPFTDTKLAIRTIEEDGGVILMGFSSEEDVERVNADAAPLIDAIVKQVIFPPCYDSSNAQSSSALTKTKSSVAPSKWPPQGNISLYASLWPQLNSPRSLVTAPWFPQDCQPFSADGDGAI